ncbi:MAG: hypothetical protein EP329_16720 [Deltaproteobacteria bacterium]|nr:MAG: hypothetical protein EP329_16720 [Deltaproteobacteria bacterium]
MSAALDIVSPIRQPAALATAEVVAGTRSNHPPVEARALKVGRRGVILEGVDLALGAHAWVRMTLPSGDRIRPLVQVTGLTDAGTACRFVHVFPNERRLLDAYHEARATPQGY